MGGIIFESAIVQLGSLSEKIPTEAQFPFLPLCPHNSPNTELIGFSHHYSPTQDKLGWGE